MARTLPLPPHPDPATCETARAVVEQGGVLAVPTESFYGLAASAWRPAALQRIYDIKGRPAGMPLLLLLGDRAQLSELVARVPPAAQILIERFWPGPLTIVFPASPSIAPEITAHTGTVGVRQPAAPALCAVLRATGAVTGTSANVSGQAPATSAQAVEALLGDRIDLILDGGPTPGGPPSTLVDAGAPPRILREGAVPREQIAAALRAAGLELA